MKKYGMLLFSIFIFLLTTFTYINENTNLCLPAYKEPAIDFESERFGRIRNIVWANYSSPKEPHIFILAEDVPGTDKSTSFIYDLNIVTGKSTILASFQINESLRGFMDYWSSEGIYTVSNLGLEVIKPHLDPETDKVNTERTSYSITDFGDVDSITVLDKIYYTKSSDKLLYIQEIPSAGFSFNNQDGQSVSRALYLPADKVLSYPDTGAIYYTKRRKDGVSAYMMEERRGGSGVKLSLAAKDFIYSRSSVFPSQAFVILTDEGDKFGILYKGNLIGKINKRADSMSQIPDLQLRRVNNDFSMAYTSFKEKGIGSIYYSYYLSGTPVEIVKEQPIVGPLRLPIRHDRNELLFFTYENNEIHIKTCRTDGTEIRDITEYIR